MSSDAVSQDGLWRWDGRQWVPNRVAPPPPPPSASPWPAATTAAPPAAGAAGKPVIGLVVSALVVGSVGLLVIAVQVAGDTVRAFGDHASYDRPWYFATWVLVVRLVVGVAALALAGVAVVRRPGRLTSVVLAIAAVVLVLGLMDLYYAVVVNHLGYDIPL